MAKCIMKFSDMDTNDQQVIREIIKNHLEKSYMVFPDEWGFSNLDIEQINYDLTINMKD